jgi:FKBP-type peptidyl-prolyl cis-trans isomerase SlyD
LSSRRRDLTVAFGVLASVVGILALIGSVAAQQTDLDKARFHYRVGVKALENNDLQVARDEFQEAARLAPQNALIWFNVALVQSKLGATKEAREALDRATNLGLPKELKERSEDLLASLEYAERRAQKDEAVRSKEIDEALKIEKGSTVKIDYTLRDDKGEVLDSNAGKAPLAFKQGARQIIPGLDKAVLGMKAGDTKKVVVQPEEAYGKVDPKAETEVPKESLPEGEVVVGRRLMARGRDGNPRPVTIKIVKDKTVVLDLNHPLAGKTLVFDIKVVSIEPPGTTPPATPPK